MRTLKSLFDNNRQWAEGALSKDPEFFGRLARQQNPEFLWIGCSDSRVPANEIIGLQPGEVFVHRNVANIVNHSDLNCLSVMQYAVEVLRVKHIMVVGHYGCGGVKAVLDRQRSGLIDYWLHPISQILDQQRDHWQSIQSDEERWDRLCEANVAAHTQAAFETTIVRDAWARGQQLSVHGWIYSLRDGRLRDLGITVTSQQEADALSVPGAIRKQAGL